MYKEIFDEVVSIMQNHYAGYIDKKGWDNPEKYIRMVEDLEECDKNDQAFIDIVQSYLLDFKDRHVFFIKSEESKLKDSDVGFKVRRYEESLVVTEVMDDARLKVGQKIESLDDRSIEELSESYQKQLYFETNERQKWNELLLNHETFESDGHSYAFRRFDKKKYESVHKGELLNDDTLMFTFTDFIDNRPVDKVIDKFKEELEKVDNLIIDVRTNLGGSSFAYQNFFKYLFPKGEVNLQDDNYKMEFNLTEKNSDWLLELYEGMTKDGSTHLDGMMAFIKANKGNGFASLSDDPDFLIIGKGSPSNIIVLTDTFCASAGDAFALTAQLSPKVTIVGRDTLGVLDYANLNIRKYENSFEFYYPTSRYSDRNDNVITGRAKPDIYIPWTPEHTEEDIDLKKALEVIDK
ncbi:hypothetical protein FO441_08570 [Salinicoccus cyprini]|uniref:Tail specific protease domain-containing protein n=1 Tax=Salinicoccus cyprini TaxID=2493691 RepID=A0A558AU00_9STAP|nr:S41 family peptidase [Salinicoccus cyprini]TVT27750.1 hypothetical protein FO441_08570 [Salinicoccus cyprini]